MKPLLSIVHMLSRLPLWLAGFTVVLLITLTIGEMVMEFVFQLKMRMVREFTYPLLGVIAGCALPIVGGREDQHSFTMLSRVFKGSAKWLWFVFVDVLSAGLLIVPAITLSNIAEQVRGNSEFPKRLASFIGQGITIYVLVIVVAMIILIMRALTTLIAGPKSVHSGPTG